MGLLHTMTPRAVRTADDQHTCIKEESHSFKNVNQPIRIAQKKTKEIQ